LNLSVIYIFFHLPLFSHLQSIRNETKTSWLLPSQTSPSAERLKVLIRGCSCECLHCRSCQSSCRGDCWSDWKPSDLKKVFDKWPQSIHMFFLVHQYVTLRLFVLSGQQLMLTAAAPAPVTPQPVYPSYGYPAAAAGYPAPPAYGFNM